jgi:Flp pilus assembly secretin CpaC
MKTICLKAAALGALALSLASAVSAEALYVETGKAMPVRINGSASSIVVGNNNVADVTAHNDQLLFVTGKSYGTTNLLVFDKAGRQIYSAEVMVTTSSTNLVTINRAGQSYTYDCSPNCKAVLSTGDEPGHFAALIDQQLQSQTLTAGQ